MLRSLRLPTLLTSLLAGQSPIFGATADTRFLSLLSDRSATAHGAVEQFESDFIGAEERLDKTGFDYHPVNENLRRAFRYALLWFLAFTHPNDGAYLAG